MHTLIRLLRFVRPYRWHALATFVCLLAMTGLSLVVPEIIRRVIDIGLAARDARFMALMGLLLIGLGLARALIGFAERYLTEWISHRIAYDLRNELYEKIQRLPFGFHDHAQTGQLMSRCTEDVTSTQRFLGTGLVDLANTALLLGGISAILFRANAALALIALAPMLALALLTAKFGTIVGPAFYRIDQALGNLSAILQENLSGAQVVRAFAREAHEIEKFGQANRSLYEARVSIIRLWGRIMPTSRLLVMVSTALILWFGGHLMQAGSLTLGQVVAFNSYLLLLAAPVDRLGWLVNLGGEAVAGGRRLFELLDEAPGIQDPANAAVLPRLRGRVEFRDVSFAYRGERRALHHVSFVAEPNQVIALIGPTGSGKTSVVNLIPRFYDVTGGSVQVDGRDVRGVDLRSLRRQIGIVLQTSLLFSVSLRDNIAYGREDASEAEIIAAARAAHAHEFILSFPHGYDTVVGERGVTLSGGQRQRVAIARALLMDPRILILDDSTSSVDTQTEHLIQQALAGLMTDRTTFVIAQRLTTVKRADLILVMDGGRIVQRGRHADLLEQPGLYREIYDLQLRDQEQFRREMLFLAEQPSGNGREHAVMQPEDGRQMGE